MREALDHIIGNRAFHSDNDKALALERAARRRRRMRTGTVMVMVMVMVPRARDGRTLRSLWWLRLAHQGQEQVGNSETQRQQRLQGG